MSRLPKPRIQSAYTTCPPAIARTGRPSGARMKRPFASAPAGPLGAPKRPASSPAIGRGGGPRRGGGGPPPPPPPPPPPLFPRIAWGGGGGGGGEVTQGGKGRRSR